MTDRAKSPIGWERFQQLVATVEAALGSNANVQSPAKIRDRDGVVREVDVLIEFTHAWRTHRIGIECRRRIRPQGVDWIDEIVGKYRNLSMDKVVAVSESGFTEPAMTKARANNIEALTLRECDMSDWAFALRMGYIRVSVPRVRLLAAGFTYTADSIEPTHPAMSGPIAQHRFRAGDGFTYDYIDLWYRYVAPKLHGTQPLRAHAKARESYTIDFDENEQFFFEEDQNVWPVSAVDIEAEYWVAKEDIPLLPAREYRDLRDDEVRGGVMVSERPIEIRGVPFDIVFVYQPPKSHDSDPILRVGWGPHKAVNAEALEHARRVWESMGTHLQLGLTLSDGTKKTISVDLRL